MAQVAGRLTGSVVDAQGAAIPGAKVDVRLPNGQTAVFNTTTNEEGLFVLTAVRPDFYDVTIEAPGFVKTTLRGVKVDPARDTALPAVKLEIASVAETIEVSAEIQGVQTANAEISTTVTNTQIRNLPVLDRQVISLLKTQAGVIEGRGPTVVNGMRTSYATVTIDGVNIQDNFIRSNSLDFIPNRIAVDQVGEVTISTSNANSTIGGGAAQMSFITPSGSNQFHGNGYWYNRNNRFAANDWFNNADGVEKPALNQNQLGGSIGGPIIKDKLLFYANYEALRLHQETLVNRTILTEDARNGIFSYVAGGAVRKANLLQVGNATRDPYMTDLIGKVPAPSNGNNFRLGDSRPDLLLNTIGYSFNARDNLTRDNITFKADYNLSPAHSFTGSYLWNREITDRPDLELSFNTVPSVQNDSSRNLFAAAWRWTPSATLTNELRGGANISPARFTNTEQFGDFILDPVNGDVYGSLLFSYPLNTYLLPQGRDTNTYNLQDNASWVKGRHNVQFGFQMQRIYTAPYNDAGIIPTYSLGFGPSNSNALTAAQLPGIASADLSRANTLLSNIAGITSEATQVFNVSSRTSGFVPGQTDLRHYGYHNFAFYVQDNWKVSQRLTLNLGLRHEYYTRLDERDGLALLPTGPGNFIDQLMNPDGVLDFAGGDTGRKFYDKDLNNFAPNVGLAWDLFGDGKTAFRAGAGISYVNDDTIAAVRNNVITNSGLQSTATINDLAGRLTGQLDTVPTPTFHVPITYADNYALDPLTAFGQPDPGLRIPYVAQWNLGLQHEIKGFVFEGRYVANKLTKGMRAFDYNQININAGGFLDDFKRAKSNGEIARAATGTFDPRYNSALPGSQPLPVFGTLPSGGLLTNGTIRQYIERNEAGGLAYIYQSNGLNGPISFFANPNALGLNTMANYSNSSYHSAQFEVRRRTTSGLQLQANYTFGKVLADALGDGQARFEPFLDMNNPGIERARAPFDLRHAFKTNFVMPLPMGRGHRVNVPALSKVFTGWLVGGILTWQSGTPFSVFSDRSTFNRTGSRSVGKNTAITTESGDALFSKVGGIFMTGNGPTFVDPAILAPTGRAVPPDGSAAYSGQIFFNPGAGEIGSMQRRMFSGPSVFNLDFSVVKQTPITETQSIEFRMEAFNFLNNASFYVGDEGASTTRFNINNTTFGTITESFYSPRRFQFGLYYRF